MDSLVRMPWRNVNTLLRTAAVLLLLLTANSGTSAEGYLRCVHTEPRIKQSQQHRKQSHHHCVQYNTTPTHSMRSCSRSHFKSFS